MNFKQLDRLSMSVNILPENYDFEHITHPDLGAKTN